MNKTSISNDLDLAEKALEVMGFECIGIDRDTAHRRFYKNGCENVVLKSTSSLSNDLVAEGKRWLLDSEHRLSIDLFERDGERLAYVVVFSDDNMQWVRIYDVEAPTENEAVLRAVVEIGKKEN